MSNKPRNHQWERSICRHQRGKPDLMPNGLPVETLVLFIGTDRMAKIHDFPPVHVAVALPASIDG